MTSQSAKCAPVRCALALLVLVSTTMSGGCTRELWRKSRVRADVSAIGLRVDVSDP